MPLSPGIGLGLTTRSNVAGGGAGPSNNYVIESGADFYVAENGTDSYVTET